MVDRSKFQRSSSLQKTDGRQIQCTRVEQRCRRRFPTECDADYTVSRQETAVSRRTELGAPLFGRLLRRMEVVLAAKGGALR